MPLSLILISFLVLKSIGIAVSLADSLVGGAGGTDFQKKIAKFAAWMAKKVFSAVTGGFGKLIADNPAVQKMKETREKVQERIKQMAGRK